MQSRLSVIDFSYVPISFPELVTDLTLECFLKREQGSNLKYMELKFNFIMISSMLLRGNAAQT